MKWVIPFRHLFGMIFVIAYVMPKPIEITVTESVEDLKKLLSKAALHHRPRLKMLSVIAQGTHLNATLAAKTGAGLRSIVRWKQAYVAGGLQGLLLDKRGGDMRSALTDQDKEKISQKLSDPSDAFTSFGQAQLWIRDNLGVEMGYHAVNKYLKRNFGARLKVGRKSHVKKDAEAVAFFKKPVEEA